MEGSVTLSSEYHIPSNIYCLYRCIRRQYEQYVCKRIPGKQAVVVMACDNTHIRHAHSVEFSLSLYIFFLLQKHIMEAPFLRFWDFTLCLLFGSYSKFYHFSKFACFQNVLNYRKKRKQRQKYLFFKP